MDLPFFLPSNNNNKIMRMKHSNDSYVNTLYIEAY